MKTLQTLFSAIYYLKFLKLLLLVGNLASEVKISSNINCLCFSYLEKTCLNRNTRCIFEKDSIIAFYQQVFIRGEGNSQGKFNYSKYTVDLKTDLGQRAFNVSLAKLKILSKIIL